MGNEQSLPRYPGWSWMKTRSVLTSLSAFFSISMAAPH